MRSDAGQHPLHRGAEIVLRLLLPVLVRLLVALEGLREHGDSVKPLHVGHPVPAGHDQPEREPVLGRERLAVHLVGQEHFGAQRLVERKASLVVCSHRPGSPRSSPVKSTSTAPSSTPPPPAAGRSGVPVHSAVPTASANQGWLNGRGARRARPLPAHSSVHASVTVGRSCSSSSDARRPRPRAPPIARRQGRDRRAGCRSG